MYHERKNKLSNQVDGSIAKNLRRAFAREYCRAVAVTLPEVSFSALLELESDVIGLAPSEAILWNGARALPAFEPTRLIEDLLKKLRWPDEHIQALQRQEQVWRTIFLT